MKHPMLVLFGSAIGAGIVVGALILPMLMCGSTSHESGGDWNNFASADRLVKASDRIVTALYLDEESHEIPEISPEDGKPYSTVEAIYRRFKVVETLKGDTVSGEIVFVASSSSFSWKLDDGQWRTEHYEVIPVSPDQEYVLFLKGTPRPDRYPAQYGDTVWARVGEPGIAVIDPSGDLIFMSTERFKSDHRVRDDSGALFVLSKTQLQSLVASE